MFRVSARTVLQLGAELISSDAVAFYELIKNAFDACSETVIIRVIVRVPFEVVHSATAAIKTAEDTSQKKQERIKNLATCKELITAAIVSDAPGSDVLRDEVRAAENWDGLRLIMDEANSIEIEDSGDGMSLADLKDVYLTIGTRSRLKEREEEARKPSPSGTRTILGEKGLGRLSAMRLGQKLRVTTSRKKEKSWNVLEIDWRSFSHDSDDLLENIKIEPTVGDAKKNVATSGTIIRITSLTGSWDKTKLQSIADNEFSKLTDPFVPKSRYPISLSFNGTAVQINPFDKLLMKYAHATGTVKFESEGGEDDSPRLSGRIDYRLRSREKTFTLEGEHILSTAKLDSVAALESLGPFTAEVAWFNRKTLKEMEDNVEEVTRVLQLQERWAGGLMVFRDAFRVYPYGSPDDDWLDLDKKALASGGYKVNRRQLVGRVVITMKANPALLDQSNREGLRDCEEKRVLILLLKYFLETQFRGFLNQVEKELKVSEPTTFDDLEEHIERSQEKIASAIRTLVDKYPKVGTDSDVVTALNDAITDLNRRLKDAKALAESFDTRHAQVIHLAGTGLMVEMLAHELNRATSNALATLSDAGKQVLPTASANLVTTLHSELTTLQRRLKILDPLSTAGRQRKETFNLSDWIEEILGTHREQFEKEGIAWKVRTTPERSTLKVKAVKGMIVQVVENLISNSVYWLKQKKKLERTFRPQVDVVIDTGKREIRFSDNGPGIPVASKDEVFQPFITTKPPGDGKGLGLYIAREVASYNGASLKVSDQVTTRAGYLNTVIFTLGDGT